MANANKTEIIERLRRSVVRSAEVDNAVKAISKSLADREPEPLDPTAALNDVQGSRSVEFEGFDTTIR